MAPRNTTKEFLRCPCCGSGATREKFTKGALGAYALQALRQAFVGRGNGTNGGAVIWTRRPMSRPELERVGAAVATASAVVQQQLGMDITPAAPEAILASIESDDEATQVGQEWIDEAREELERRQQIVAADELQRDAARRQTFGDDE